MYGDKLRVVAEEVVPKSVVDEAHKRALEVIEGLRAATDFETLTLEDAVHATFICGFVEGVDYAIRIKEFMS